jgi:hypothetical protein
VIGAIWWTVRRFGSGRLGSNTRGRQPRLAVIDYASVDNRRRLILVRRDNIEHLLMIGGPTDIVVEPNIVRAVAATRDVGRAPAGIEAITRAIPLPDNGSGSWPLQPDGNGGARPGVRPDTPHDDVPGRPHAEPRQRDTLAALADELSTRMPPPRNRGNVAEPPRPDQRQESRQEQRQEPRQDQRQDQRQEQRTEPRLEPRKPAQPAGPASPPPASAGATSEAAPGGEQSLADMAQRLEAALRKPAGEARPGSPARPAALPEASRSESAPPAPPRNSRAGEQRPASADAGKSNQNKTAVYDTLEQEMANLLGRPSKS